MLRLSLLACALFLGSSLGAQTNAYVVSGNSSTSHLYASDISTGGSSLIAEVTFGIYPRYLAWGGNPPALWTIATNTNSIGTISTTNAAYSARRALNLAIGVVVIDLAWSPARSEFWISLWDSNARVYSALAYTPATNGLRTVGAFPISSEHDLAFDAMGNLWGRVDRILYLIDPQTLAHRYIRLLDRQLNRLCIDTSRGAFLGMEDASGICMELDPATGQSRLLAPVGLGLQVVGWTVVPGICRGRFLPTGTSCPGTGGVDPILDGYGCYGNGGTVHVSLRQAMSGATGILLFGLGPASIPLGNGCTLNIGPVFADPIVALPLFGTGGAGQGFTTVNFTVPQNTVVSSLALQALVFDVGAPGAFSATNGLRLVVE